MFVFGLMWLKLLALVLVNNMVNTDALFLNTPICLAQGGEINTVRVEEAEGG